MREKIFTVLFSLEVVINLLVCAILVCFIYSARVEAKENNISAKSLEKIIILHNGRKKPLGTFAEIKLYEYSGKRSIAGESAIDWLAAVLFTPQKILDKKVFLINNSAAAVAAGLVPVKKRRYCFSRIKEKYEKIMIMSEAFSGKPAGELDHSEQEIIRLAANISDFLLLKSEFAKFLPHDDFTVKAPEVKQRLNLYDDRDIYSCFEMSSRAVTISSALDSLSVIKTGLLPDSDIKMLRLASRLNNWKKKEPAGIVKILPVYSQGREEWYSPGEITVFSGSIKGKDSAMVIIQKIVNSYRGAKQDEFDKYVADYAVFIRDMWKTKIEMPEPETELIYNKVKPFVKAKILYGISLIPVVIILAAVSRRWIYCLVIVLLSSGFLFHTFGLIARFMITHRPPVTNMYETFVFVAWAGILLGAAVEYIVRRSAGLLTASVTGFLFLYIAGKYSLESDTMGMLAAVLNSNFWLTSHIITIILGYTGCLCAGILAHIYLIRNTFLKKSFKDKSLFDSLYGVLGFGLMFTVTGTLLGGMWADQSWGRFWGWDPKENGALLIILWCSILFHSKAGGITGSFGFAAGAVFTVVVVMFAWIGVNLLGVGLHSYGFTGRGFIILVSVTAFEAFFIGAAVLVKYLRSRNIKKTG